MAGVPAEERAPVGAGRPCGDRRQDCDVSRAGYYGRKQGSAARPRLAAGRTLETRIVSDAISLERAGAVRSFKPYPAYKDSGVVWLGEIPAHWAVKRLPSTVTSCQNGVWGDEPDVLHDIVCVRVANFDRLTFRVDVADPTLRSIEPRVAAGRALRRGDLLLEKSGGRRESASRSGCSV